MQERLPRRWKLEQRTTPWMEEVEPRREQRSRSSCRSNCRTNRSGPTIFCISSVSAIAPCIALTSSVPAGRLAVRRRKLRLQGKDCSYNPIAFPPSLVVRRRTTAGQGLFPTILLHFHRPWRSDAGRYDSRARIVPTILLHFLHPWRSEGGRLQGCRR